MPSPDRVKSGEDGLVVACPECDAAGVVYRRTGKNTYIGNPDDPYACGKCSATFTEPVLREPKRKGPKPLSGGQMSKLEKILAGDAE